MKRHIINIMLSTKCKQAYCKGYSPSPTLPLFFDTDIKTDSNTSKLSKQ